MIDLRCGLWFANIDFIAVLPPPRQSAAVDGHEFGPQARSAARILGSLSRERLIAGE
jgi:hypothetical protein